MSASFVVIALIIELVKDTRASSYFSLFSGAFSPAACTVSLCSSANKEEKNSVMLPHLIIQSMPQKTHHGAQRREGNMKIGAGWRVVGAPWLIRHNEQCGTTNQFTSSSLCTALIFTPVFHCIEFSHRCCSQHMKAQVFMELTTSYVGLWPWLSLNFITPIIQTNPNTEI